MAKKDEKTDVQPAFEVYSKHPQYSGVHPLKIRFQDGLARTADLALACKCRDAGLAVFDVNDEDGAKAAKAFAAARAAEFAAK